MAGARPSYSFPLLSACKRHRSPCCRAQPFGQGNHSGFRQALPSMHRPAGKTQAQRQKFLEGRVAGRENLFPKRFPSPQAFLPSNLQASACRPQNKKIPGGAGTKKDPLALRAARGSRTIFGSGLLSHMTLCSIIGDGELNFRVRNGVGCTLSSMATKEIWQIY